MAITTFILCPPAQPAQPSVAAVVLLWIWTLRQDMARHGTAYSHRSDIHERAPLSFWIRSRSCPGRECPLPLPPLSTRPRPANESAVVSHGSRRRCAAKLPRCVAPLAAAGYTCGLHRAPGHNSYSGLARLATPRHATPHPLLQLELGGESRLVSLEQWHVLGM